MKTHVLILQPTIKPATVIKDALEGTGRFAVYPFIDLSAALDLLRDHWVDVVIVDLHVDAQSGWRVIENMLKVRPDVTIVVSTHDANLAQQAADHGAAAVLDPGYSARDVLNLVEKRLKVGAAAEALDEDDPIDGETVMIDEVPVTDPPLPDDPDATASGVTEWLAADEPPFPDFSEGGTVTDLMTGLTAELEPIDPALLDVLREQLEPIEWDDDDEESDTPARLILENSSDDSQPLGNISLDDYLALMRQDRDELSYIREPDFLGEGAVMEDVEDDVTRASDENPPLLDEMQAMSTATLPTPAADSPPPTSESDSDNVGPVDDQPDADIPEESTPFAALDDDPFRPEADAPPMSDTGPQAPAFAAPPSQVMGAPEDELGNWGPPDAIKDVVPGDVDPTVVQLAVSLTQASLESTAEATLLTQGDDVIAYEGQLSDSDIVELMPVINNQDDELVEGQSRIRFITLSSSGLDYMVYSCRTYESYILSMVFAGRTPLRNIRQQGRRLLDALESVPELPPEDYMEQLSDVPEPEATRTKPSKGGMVLESQATVADMPSAKYTFVWLLADPNQTLSHATAEAIDARLRTYFVEEGWEFDQVEVQDDYVYVVVDVPGEDTPPDVIRQLKAAAAVGAAKEDPTLDPKHLWADSYFILAPGRPLNPQEIQEYLNFQRL